MIRNIAILNYARPQSRRVQAQYAMLLCAPACSYHFG
jgi:hypothetical protein